MERGDCPRPSRLLPAVPPGRGTAFTGRFLLRVVPPCLCSYPAFPQPNPGRRWLSVVEDKGFVVLAPLCLTPFGVVIAEYQVIHASETAPVDPGCPYPVVHALWVLSAAEGRRPLR